MSQPAAQLEAHPARPEAPEADRPFVKVTPQEHPLPRASEVAVYFQDYYRSSSKIGRFGKIVGVDPAAGSLGEHSHHLCERPLRRRPRYLES